MPWGAIASAIGAIGSAIIGHSQAEDSSAIQYANQTKLNKQNYKYNVKLINKQNAFNERMMDKANAFNENIWNQTVDLSNTAHQREVADLRAAGLNPILSANGGASVVNPIQSAQTSSGNSQLSSSAGLPDVDYLSAMDTAMNMRNAYKSTESQLKNDSRNRLYTSALTDKVYTDVDNSVRTTASEISKRDAEIQQIANDMNVANYDAQTRRMAVLNDISSSTYQNKYNQALTNSAVAELQGRKATEKAQADWIKKHPKLYSFGQTMQNIAPALVGGGLAGSAGAQIYNASKKQPVARRRR